MDTSIEQFAIAMKEYIPDGHWEHLQKSKESDALTKQIFLLVMKAQQSGGNYSEIRRNERELEDMIKIDKSKLRKRAAYDELIKSLP